MRPDDAQCDALGGELAMQLVQHAGAGEIDIGRAGKIADHQADVDGVAERSRRKTVSMTASALT